MTIIGLALLENVSMTSVAQWYVPLREGCEEARTSRLSPEAAMAVARRDGYEYQVAGSGGEHPEILVIKSKHPVFKPTGGRMMFARSLTACERLRTLGAFWDALEDKRYD